MDEPAGIPISEGTIQNFLFEVYRILEGFERWLCFCLLLLLGDSKSVPEDDKKSVPVKVALLSVLRHESVPAETSKTTVKVYQTRR